MKNCGSLLPETQAVLDRLISSAPAVLRHVVLSGGSALALHLQHRLSEDLDFITYENWFDRRQLFRIMASFEHKQLLHESEEQIDLLLNDVKVTFFNANWSFLRPENPEEQLHLATLEQLAAMKTHALFVRARFRDYYDLYVLAKERFTLPEIFRHASRIVEGINFKLFSIALVYTDDIEDDNIQHLKPKYPVSKQEISSYFVNELKRLQPW